MASPATIQRHAPADHIPPHQHHRADRAEPGPPTSGPPPYIHPSLFLSIQPFFFPPLPRSSHPNLSLIARLRTDGGLGEPAGPAARALATAICSAKKPKEKQCGERRPRLPAGERDHAEGRSLAGVQKNLGAAKSEGGPVRQQQPPPSPPNPPARSGPDIPGSRTQTAEPRQLACRLDMQRLLISQHATGPSSAPRGHMLLDAAPAGPG
ncbi:unnamed protein product [Gadus morhua 'NCC']